MTVRAMLSARRSGPATQPRLPPLGSRPEEREGEDGKGGRGGWGDGELKPRRDQETSTRPQSRSGVTIIIPHKAG